MKRLIFVSLLLPLVFLQPAKTAQAQKVEKIPAQSMAVSAKVLDPKAVILRDYFSKYNSPLQDYAQDFIDASNQYGVDWKLLPAIAGVESTFGQNTPGGYNDWGWGVYGNQAIYFNSQRDGIFTVAQGLKDSYISKGITSPYEINYTYAASPFWGGKVAYFMNDLNQFSRSYKNSELTVDPNQLQTQSYSASASLTQPSLPKLALGQ